MRQTVPLRASLAIAIITGFWSTSAQAEDGQRGVPVSASASAGTPLTQGEFHNALAERDAIIIDLLRRVRALENRVTVEQPVDHSNQAQPDVSAAIAPQPSTASAEPAAPQPGQFVVDELAAERALERSLVDTGALLLPQGQAEFSPLFSFQQISLSDASTAVIDGDTFVSNRTITQDVFSAGLSLRYGLPWQSQIELFLPYRVVGRAETSDVLGSIVSNQHTTGRGIGDLRIGLAKTLLGGGDGQLGLIGRLTWDSGTGKGTDNGIALGAGFNELQGSLTAIHRLDPLVLIGSLGYQYTFEKDGIQPGKEYLFSFGTSLAVSPEASLSLFFNQSYRDDLKIGGTSIDGTGELVSSMSVGTSIIVSPRMLLQVNAGTGLTNGAPDYSLFVSLPFRF